MEHTYRLQICGTERELPLVPMDEKMAYASFVVIGDTELVELAAVQLAREIPQTDVVMTAEAKGIALAYELSRQLGLKEFIVARKSVKSYMKNTISASVHSITTKGEQHIYLDETDIRKVAGKRVCIVDDVISTGESLRAVEELAEKAGGKVVCRAAILAEGDAAKRKDILFLEELPLFEKKENGEYAPIREKENV
ncbi:MAG TPA: adenine phosphoribosyltransferase [Candidatus Lachnoclostridium stercorigallinarum]|uniref:Adenine phosphoribosyltransferase n=1 Tax=Candidatus Lachnoclostridium stercorigallinarum TaxID=2838634 RepID=A0A9D2K5D0_9FIRM|nr:adenine phosphoribosyltransferase [Candidatus Lachnoclostridium stercorigallinarum]